MAQPVDKHAYRECLFFFFSVFVVVVFVCLLFLFRFVLFFFFFALSAQSSQRNFISGYALGTFGGNEIIKMAD